MATETMLEAEGLTKRFGTTQALASVDLAVPAGSILGVLGPNGAGKTTTIRILTTLTVPASGHARVAGFDVVRNPAAVRWHIGVTAQDATLDEALTGRQNLVMIGELSRMARRDARARAEDLLRTFELTDAAGRVLRAQGLFGRHARTGPRPAALCGLAPDQLRPVPVQPAAAGPGLAGPRERGTNASIRTDNERTDGRWQHPWFPARRRRVSRRATRPSEWARSSCP